MIVGWSTALPFIKLQLALELKRAMGRIAFLGNAAPRRFYGRRPRIGYASPPLTTDAPS
jgi:hypothetical protein